MPNLSIGLPPMPAMPLLTPISIGPLQPLVPVSLTLPLIRCQGNPGLPNGTVGLLPPPLVHNSTGRLCPGTVLTSSIARVSS